MGGLNPISQDLKARPVQQSTRTLLDSISDALRALLPRSLSPQPARDNPQANPLGTLGNTTVREGQQIGGEMLQQAASPPKTKEQQIKEIQGKIATLTGQIEKLQSQQRKPQGAPGPGRGAINARANEIKRKQTEIYKLNAQITNLQSS